MSKFKGSRFAKVPGASIAPTPKPKPCLACNGSGRYDANDSPKCISCNGTGIAQAVQPTNEGTK